MNNLYSKSALQKLITYLYIVFISTLVLLAFESSQVKANWQPLNAWFFFSTIYKAKSGQSGLGLCEISLRTGNLRAAVSQCPNRRMYVSYWTVGG